MFDAETMLQFFPNVYEMGSCWSRNAVQIAANIPDTSDTSNTSDTVTNDLETPLNAVVLPPPPSYGVKFLFSNYTLTIDTTVPLFGNVALSLVENDALYAVKVVFNADDAMDYYVERECLFILVDTTMDARGTAMTSFLIPCSLAFTRICVVKPKSMPPLLFSERT